MARLLSDSPAATAPVGAALAERWRVLHDAAGVVATLGDVPAAAVNDVPDGFPTSLMALDGWRRRLAEQTVEDLTLILRTGISALLSARQRQAPTEASARVLWNEFASARNQLSALCTAEAQHAPHI